ncbi:hypothetical protein HGM15179_021200, partial [Zosterops borbonicus]
MVFRIGIPDLHQTKCLRFDPAAAVWAAKQQLLCALTEGLHDGLNYGLFQPAAAGRDAKFLDEERPLRDYPQSFDQGVPYLEALLDLGGSPNYKDRRGLTPLYHTAMVGGDPRCCELLLYNRAHIGTADENGWQEIHQVAVIAGNFELGELIKNHRDSDV